MAFNHIGNMLVARYRDWYLALAELPSWGEHVDAQVQQYIRGVQNVVTANLNWRYVQNRLLSIWLTLSIVAFDQDGTLEMQRILCDAP